jgi:hypothetical protein
LKNWWLLIETLSINFAWHKKMYFSKVFWLKGQAPHSFVYHTVLTPSFVLSPFPFPWYPLF